MTVNFCRGVPTSTSMKYCVPFLLKIGIWSTWGHVVYGVRAWLRERERGEREREEVMSTPPPTCPHTPGPVGGRVIMKYCVPVLLKIGIWSTCFNVLGQRESESVCVCVCVCVCEGETVCVCV